ncbi:hypothetical protein [Streptomyces sp. NPDC093089]|uniref:hypothetical protein n=1 Tax=Streptomyces sp. NPDC093089 TaxID=3366024 RepID=UPI003805D7EC
MAVRSVMSGHAYQHSGAVQQRILAAVAALDPLPRWKRYALPEGTRVALAQRLQVREQVVEDNGAVRAWLNTTDLTTGTKGVIATGTRAPGYRVRI